MVEVFGSEVSLEGWSANYRKAVVEACSSSWGDLWSLMSRV